MEVFVLTNCHGHGTLLSGEDLALELTIDFFMRDKYFHSVRYNSACSEWSSGVWIMTC
jgi:hypothetical protein